MSEDRSGRPIGIVGPQAVELPFRDHGNVGCLRVRGCRHVGLLTVSGPEGPMIAHAFDDDPAKLVMNIGAYVAREGDTVPASAFADALAHVRIIRAGPFDATP